jgi:hypothetical protein
MLFQCRTIYQVVYRHSNTHEYFLRILLPAPGDLLSPSCSGILSSSEINEVSVSAAGFACLVQVVLRSYGKKN